jgi:hypothetical protein
LGSECNLYGLFHVREFTRTIPGTVNCTGIFTLVILPVQFSGSPFVQAFSHP